MPYSLDAAAEAAIVAGRMKSALLVDLYCKDGGGDPQTFRFWSWTGQLTYPANDDVDDTDDVTYESLARRTLIDGGIKFAASLQAEALTITFDAARANDDDDLIGAYVDAVWHQGRVRVRRILLNIDTGASPTDPVWEWHGRQDHRTFQRQAGQEQSLVLNCEGGLFRISGRNMHTRTHADQQRRLAGDLFFQGTPIMIGLPPIWAKAPASIPGVGKSSSGGGAGIGAPSTGEGPGGNGGRNSD